MTTQAILEAAVAAKADMAELTTDQKNTAIRAMADALLASSDTIVAANRLDVADSRGHISDVMLDRLTLTQARIDQMAEGMRNVAELPDPVGRILSRTVLPNGLLVEKTSVPLGVIGIIYESRPNVTSDAAVLAFKSGNVCVLRGGKEAYRTSAAIVTALRQGLRACSLPETLINMLEDTSRAGATAMMTAKGYLDLLIPRGGKGLIRSCVENATVPCIETGTGICHIYVDGAADPAMALRVLTNAKTSRPSVCNACEVCLVDRRIAPAFLPALKAHLQQGPHPVELRLDPEAAAIIEGTPAGPDDFDTEFLDYILAVGIVDGVNDAVRHIALHSTGHSEAIITSDPEAADFFCRHVDSAAVYVNASTRFTDGGEFGLGCEVGISTQKLHARGPMGLAELTTYKYIVRGDGQIRE
jgi:glutamate-5-semialdehyde dehydrogenase